MINIPATYELSRERFRASAASISTRWADCHTLSHSLPDNPDLTIDVLAADATREKQKLLIITTGLHGIEGYVGAAVLQLFIEEFLPRLDPETTGLLLIHPINPYGMKHRTRVNQKGIDHSSSKLFLIPRVTTRRLFFSTSTRATVRAGR